MRDHVADDSAGFAGRVRGGTHAPEAMEDDTRDGVHHGGEGRDGQDIAGDFDRALFGRAFDLLDALRVRHRADVPDVAENVAGVGSQQSGDLAVESPSADQRVFVNVPRGFVEEERDRRNVGLGAIETDVALALLLGIVKRMRVKKRRRIGG